MKQKVYFQPKNTGLCGQYAIANLLGITPDESIKAFGKRGGKTRKSGTQTKDISKAVKELGYYCDGRSLGSLQKGNDNMFRRWHLQIT